MEKQTNEYDLMIAIINKINIVTLVNQTDDVVQIYEKLKDAIKKNK